MYRTGNCIADHESGAAHGLPLWLNWFTDSDGKQDLTYADTDMVVKKCIDALGRGNVYVLFEQDDLGLSFFMTAARHESADLLCRIITELLHIIQKSGKDKASAGTVADEKESSGDTEKHSYLSQRALLQSLCITDLTERNILHHYITKRFKKFADIAKDQTGLCELFAILCKVGPVAKWDQQCDKVSLGSFVNVA